jgi:hypothetical protein
MVLPWHLRGHGAGKRDSADSLGGNQAPGGFFVRGPEGKLNFAFAVLAGMLEAPRRRFRAWHSRWHLMSSWIKEFA